VLLIIKKRDKVTPISLISPCAGCAGTYKIQASNNLSPLPSSYISKLVSSTQFICRVAVKFNILFINKDLGKAFPMMGMPARQLSHSPTFWAKFFPTRQQP
jgi:hypothetical protein